MNDNKNFKPSGYNSVSSYFIVEGAQKFIDLMSRIFDAKETRRYSTPDGAIMHAEIKVDDSILMLGEASDKYPPVPLVMHVYVPNVDDVFQKAINAGCEIIEPPTQREGDPEGQLSRTLQEICGLLEHNFKIISIAENYFG